MLPVAMWPGHSCGCGFARRPCSATWRRSLVVAATRFASRRIGLCALATWLIPHGARPCAYVGVVSTNGTTAHEVAPAKVVTVSIVSHGQLALVENLLNDLAAHCETLLDVVLTLNVPEQSDAVPTHDCLSITVIRNDTPKGFGANHNAAFVNARGEFFCVMNPDIRLPADPFPALIDSVRLDGIGVAGPLVVDPGGRTEDNGRLFPTFSLLGKKLWRRVIRRLEPQPDYTIGQERIFPEWIGGMCMLFPTSIYRAVGGFDERYFLYYEDVDLCWRLRRLGFRAVLDPGAIVVHGARRSSWQSTRYMRWHLSSMLRFLVTQARR